jgi:hypothetical protein
MHVTAIPETTLYLNFVKREEKENSIKLISPKENRQIHKINAGCRYHSTRIPRLVARKIFKNGVFFQKIETSLFTKENRKRKEKVYTTLR